MHICRFEKWQKWPKMAQKWPKNGQLLTDFPLMSGAETMSKTYLVVKYLKSKQKSGHFLPIFEPF